MRKSRAPIFASQRLDLPGRLLNAAAASGNPSGTGCDQACESSPGDRPGGALGMTAAAAITVAVGVSVSVTAAAVTAIAVVVGEGGDGEGKAGDGNERYYRFCH